MLSRNMLKHSVYSQMKKKYITTFYCSKILRSLWNYYTTYTTYVHTDAVRYLDLYLNYPMYLTYSLIGIYTILGIGTETCQ